jgi:hypothetical protein
METREEDKLDLLFLVFLCHEVAPQNLQPAIPRPDVFPQIGGAMPVKYSLSLDPKKIS